MSVCELVSSFHYIDFNRTTLKKRHLFLNVNTMMLTIHSPYTYQSRGVGFLVDEVTVDVVDTSVDNVKNNISVSSQSSAKPFYTNSDVPVSVFGSGLLSTPYDPLRHKGKYDAKPQPSPAAAGASLDSNAASGAAANAAVSSSNTQTVQQ